MSATKAKIWVLVIVAVFTALVWYAVLTASHDTLRVSFLDIGQGDAIFIESPTGANMLIDAGANAKILRQLGKVLPFYDRTIDVAMATHPDKDHIGGFADVLNSYKVGMLLEDGNDSETNIDDVMQGIADQKGVKRLIATRGMVIDLGGGAQVFILFPSGNTEGWETNRASIIAKLGYGETSFMLTGDAAVISAGKDNSYGHPHKEVVDTLQSAHADIVSTAELGIITFESDGQVIVKQ
jgi:competence protein ComEC